MSTRIIDDWSYSDGRVDVEISARRGRIVLSPHSYSADRAMRFDAEELLEAIYAEFPDRRPDGSERDLEGRLEAEFEKAEQGTPRTGDLLILRDERPHGVVYEVQTSAFDWSGPGQLTRIIKRAEKKDPEWYGAKVIKAYRLGERFFVRHLGSGENWILDTGTKYTRAQIEESFTDIQIVVAADD